MNDYKKYLLSQLGLKESQFVPFVREDEHPDIDPEAQAISPTAKAPQIIGVAIRGSCTGGLPSGADRNNKDLAPTKLGGYDRVSPEDLNTTLVDKTPRNPEIGQERNPINQNPSTGDGVTHPHQIQVTAGEEPQDLTGASTDSDPTLTLKSAKPKGIDIDIADTEAEPQPEEENPMIPVTSLSETFERHKKMALEVVRQHQQLHEGKHKAGCECGFCKNKGSFKKKDKKEVDEGDDEDNHKDNPDFKLKDGEQWRKDRSASKEGDEVRKHFEKDSKDNMDENKKTRICHHCKQPHPCKCDKKDEEDAKDQRDNPEAYRKKFGMKVDKRGDLNEGYAAPFSRMRGLAGIGQMILSSNGQWGSNTVSEAHPPGANHPFVTNWKMDKEKAGYVKVDENKLKTIKAQLDRKSKRGSLSDKELELVKRLNEVLKSRKMIRESYSKTRGKCPTCTYHSNSLDPSTGLCPQCL